MRARVAVAGLFLLAATASSAPKTDAVDALLRQGNRLYASGNLLGARAAYESCLQHDSSNGLCMTNLASLLLDLAPKEPEARTLAERLYRRVLAEHGIVAGGLGSDAAFNLALLLQDDRTPSSTGEACTLYEHIVRAQVRAGEEPRFDALANLASCTHDLRATPVRAFELFAAAIVQGEAAEQGGEGREGGALGAALAPLYRGIGSLLAEADEELCAALIAADGEEGGPRVLLLPDQEDGQQQQPQQPQRGGAGEHTLRAEVGGRGGRTSARAQHRQLSAATAMEVCAANARNALHRCLELQPADAQAEHALAALAAREALAGRDAGGGTPRAEPERASPAFVRALFDDFAPTFDAQLSGLAYAVPQLIGAAVAALVASERAGRPFANALDAGCGTGLLGPELRDSVSGALVGVDLSAKMLGRARALTTAGAQGGGHGSGGQPVYDALLVADLLALGATGEESAGTALPLGLELDAVELVVAADVLVYFGELRPLLERLGSLLSGAGGRLLFSCEALEHATPAGPAGAAALQAGWALTPSGRYAHSAEYVRAAAWSSAGLEVLAHSPIVPRVDKGKEVRGHLFVLGKAARR